MACFLLCQFKVSKINIGYTIIQDRSKAIQIGPVSFPSFVLHIENKCLKLLEYKSANVNSSISVSFLIITIEFIVATALTGKASSLHTLCSCRLTELHGRPIILHLLLYRL